MSDMVTHWAVFDDCRRMVQVDETIEPLFKRLISDHHGFARLGSLTRYGTLITNHILKQIQDGGRKSNLTAKDERNLGFVLGALTHQACDKAMKPLLSKVSGEDWNRLQYAQIDQNDDLVTLKDAIEKSHEVSAYYDAEVFREVYMGGGEAEPLSIFFLTELTPQGRTLNDAIRGMYQRAFLACHTFKPDLEHIDDWLETVFNNVQPLYLDTDEWVRVYNNPDPAKIREYGVRTEFYDKNDPTIQAARLIQAGKPLPDDLRKAVYEDGETRCSYGEALQLCLLYLRRATAFWRGETDTLDAPNYESESYKAKRPTMPA